jgi:hypothetical protein
MFAFSSTGPQSSRAKRVNRTNLPSTPPTTYDNQHYIIPPQAFLFGKVL